MLRKIVTLLVLCLLILFCAEGISYFLLKKTKGENLSFFYQKQKNMAPWDGQNNAYSIIDPLLSWAIDSSFASNQGYTFYHNSVVLENIESNDSIPTIIYISGGSTSDLLFDKNNWPNSLLNIYKQKKKSVRIFESAVGGYNSGQEYLKICRDISLIQPDIHISYSGANEINQYGYYTPYEQQLYSAIINPTSIGWLPNFKELVLHKNTNLYLYQPNKIDAFEFWKQNIYQMKALSELKHYQFIGVLQPVIYYGSNMENPNFDKNLYLKYKEDYDLFYPLAIQLADTSEFINNFTGIFKNSKEIIFNDDCHLANQSDQNIIAQNIYNLFNEN